MSPSDLIYLSAISFCGFAATYIVVRYGWTTARRYLRRQERRYDVVLNKQLLLNVPARTAMGLAAAGVVMMGLVGFLLGERWEYFILAAGLGLFIPHMVITHIETKRRAKLEEQLINGITSLASGVRAGLTLVQAMELLVRNGTGPIKQEFQHLLREYNLGIDLQLAMHNASERIGSAHYRLLFAAIEAHRQRGGNMGESLDRIAAAVREIQRLEGRLHTLTSQGRNEARMMGAMPVVILVLMYFIMPKETQMLFTEAWGRLILLMASGLIVIGFLWIRRIMSVSV